MRNKAAFVFILSMILVAAPHYAGAQFWKKWFRKEEEPRARPRPHREAVKDITPVSKPRPRKSKSIDYPATVMKSRYRIDVLLPVYLDELIKNNKPSFKDRVPDKALSGLNFYEGIKLAADTLTRLGYGVDVYVHDVMDPAQTPEALIKSNGLHTSDLIIGAVPSSQLQALAKYARQSNINFISALSPSDADITDNPYFTLMQPTLETHCDKIKAVVLKKHSDRNNFLFYRTNSSVDSNAFRRILGDEGSGFRKVSCNVIPQRHQLLKLLDSMEANIIVMPILDHAYAEEILKQLYSWFPSYRFEIYGMPSWKSMSSLKKTDAYPNIIVNFTEPFYFDMSTAAGQALVNSYQKEFGGKPGEMVYRGYETLFWYIYLLNRYGTIYNPKQGDNGGAIFTRFEVKPRWTENGDLLYNENQHLYLYKYQSGSFIIEQ